MCGLTVYVCGRAGQMYIHCVLGQYNLCVLYGTYIGCGNDVLHNACTCVGFAA